jgi:C4-dicarboxylate-specific signal transduction histidine kinase
MASTQAPDRKLNITTRRDGAGNAVVSIRDAGPGMPEADLQRIFEPFFTTKNEGLGLGLSICSTIITSHRGEISLQNSSRGGMVATVLLPAA